MRRGLYMPPPATIVFALSSKKCMSIYKRVGSIGREVVDSVPLNHTGVRYYFDLLSSRKSFRWFPARKEFEESRDPFHLPCRNLLR